jgi:hypothetical protein
MMMSPWLPSRNHLYTTQFLFYAWVKFLWLLTAGNEHVGPAGRVAFVNLFVWRNMITQVYLSNCLSWSDRAFLQCYKTCNNLFQKYADHMWILSLPSLIMSSTCLTLSLSSLIMSPYLILSLPSHILSLPSLILSLPCLYCVSLCLILSLPSS